MTLLCWESAQNLEHKKIGAGLGHQALQASPAIKYDHGYALLATGVDLMGYMGSCVNISK